MSAMAPSTSKRSKSRLGSYPPRDELVNKPPIKARRNQRTLGCSPCPVQVPQMLEMPPWSLGANPRNPRDHQSCPSFRLVHYCRRQRVPQKLGVPVFGVCIPIDYTLVQMDDGESLLSALVKTRRAYLVDLDGVIYTGSRPIPGAGQFFEELRQRKLPFLLITNNSTRTGRQVSAHLKGMDVLIEPEDILTSPEATAIYLRRDWPIGTSVMVIGEEGLVRAMVGAGLHLTTDPALAKVVVCGLDRRLTYERLVRACTAIRHGASFVATNPDLALPTEQGFLPGNGATLAYLEAATGVKPTVIGKPSPVMLEIAMARLGVEQHETVMIGDGLQTDILAGVRASVATILVLSGVATIADVAHAANPPDVVIGSIDIVRQALIEHV